MLAACGSEAGPVVDEGPTHAGVDALFADLDRDDAPGAAVGVLFEGEVSDHLVVELRGEELDQFSDNDELEFYRREFAGPIDAQLGVHQPGDEGSDDPENMSNWRIGYEIEVV